MANSAPICTDSQNASRDTIPSVPVKELLTNTQGKNHSQVPSLSQEKKLNK